MCLFDRCFTLTNCQSGGFKNDIQVGVCVRADARWTKAGKSTLLVKQQYVHFTVSCVYHDDVLLSLMTCYRLFFSRRLRGCKKGMIFFKYRYNVVNPYCSQSGRRL